MIHHGNKIFEIAKSKGYKKTHLAKMLGKTSQSVDYDVKKQDLKLEVLEEYAKILNVPLSTLQEEENPKEIQNYKEKYFELLETTNRLWQVVSQHGIKVNFNFVISVPRVSSLYFFGFTNTTDNILS